MRVGIYIRVSTEEQAKEGYSLAAQENILRAWATVKNCVDPALYIEEGRSAKNLNRPVVQRLIADCRARLLDCVIVWRLDRLSRSLRDMINLVDDDLRTNNVDLISVTENIDTSTPTGRLIMNILASVAQNEREVTEARVRMTCEDIARNELRHLGGRPPYGYAVDEHGRYVIVEHEAQRVREIFARYARGAGVNRLADALNASGARTRAGGLFRGATLLDMMHNEKYIGMYVYNKSAPAARDGSRNSHAQKDEAQIVRIPGGMPAIIDMETWGRAQAHMETNRRGGGAYHAKCVYMLSGMVRCGVCGASIPVDSHGKDRNGTPQRAYTCRDRCVKRIRVERIDKLVLDYIASITQDEDILRRAVGIANESARVEAQEGAGERAVLENELSVVNGQARALVDFAASAGASAPSYVMERLRELDVRADELRREIVACSCMPVVIEDSTVAELIRDAARVGELPPEQRREAVMSIVDYVELFDDRVRVHLRVGPDGGPRKKGARPKRDARADTDTSGGGVGTPAVSVSVDLVR